MQEEGNVRVQGPLRIYWGVKKPIMLKQYDNIPSVPTPKKRYSVITDSRDLHPLPEIDYHVNIKAPLLRALDKSQMIIISVKSLRQM